MAWYEPDPDQEVRLTMFSSGWTLAVGAVIGALLAGAVWVAIVLAGDDESTAATAPQHGAAGANGPAPMDMPSMASGSQSASPAPTVADQCRAVVRAQHPVRRAARASMDQWRLHVDAMNKLVAGEITWDQANTFWDQSRVAAKQRANTFETALKDFRAQGLSCPADAGEQAGSEAAQCADAVAARNVELKRAATAIDTWRTHIHHMEMLRMGMMSHEQAAKMWLASWHTGEREIASYDAARAQTQPHGC